MVACVGLANKDIPPKTLRVLGKVVWFEPNRGSQKIPNAKAFRIFTFSLFALHFSLNSHSGFQVISNIDSEEVFAYF